MGARTLPSRPSRIGVWLPSPPLPQPPHLAGPGISLALSHAVKGRTNLKINERYLSPGLLGRKGAGSQSAPASKMLSPCCSTSSLSQYSSASAPSSPVPRKVSWLGESRGPARGASCCPPRAALAVLQPGLSSLSFQALLRWTHSGDHRGLHSCSPAGGAGLAFAPGAAGPDAEPPGECGAELLPPG